MAASQDFRLPASTSPPKVNYPTHMDISLPNTSDLRQLHPYMSSLPNTSGYVNCCLILLTHSNAIKTGLVPFTKHKFPMLALRLARKGGKLSLVNYFWLVISVEFNIAREIC